jgi:hypothetical protein
VTAHQIPERGLAIVPPPVDGRSNLRPVTIQIGNSELLGELREHFARSGFAARAVGATELVVDLPDAPDHDQGRREVGAHLLVWAVLHPEDPGDIVG